MPRIIIFKEKAVVVDGKERVVTKQTVRRVMQDEGIAHTQYGEISLNLGKGSIQGKDYSIIPSGFADEWRALERGAQIITEKDVGCIIATTGIGKDSIVGDAGSGSGSLACGLARVAKKVYSYDVDEKAVELCKKNAKKLDLDNVTFALGDITKKLSKKNFDVFILDLKQSWTALDEVVKGVKAGGWIVSYNSSIPSVSEFVNACRQRDDVLFVKTTELMQRQWKIRGLTARPSNTVLHTGFLSFVRRL